MGGNKSLKAALSSQQSRLKLKEKTIHAARVSEQKERAKTQGKSKWKGKPGHAPPLAPTIPFHSTDKILLVGEGNFSFARAIVCNPPSQLESFIPTQLTATAYDSERECFAKYPDAQGIVEGLREKGVQVLFGVDAGKLEKMSVLKGKKWDRIVWNFPHAGKGITDQDRNILSNQLIILSFLRSAATLLTPGPVPSLTPSHKRNHGPRTDEEDEDDELTDVVDDALVGRSQPDRVKSRGTVLVTLRNVIPYTKWDVPKLAKNPPPSSANTPNPRYTLLRSFLFHRSVWTGYEHRMTKGERARGFGKTGEGGEDRCWEFCLRD